jgi:hypothetical protein
MDNLLLSLAHLTPGDLCGSLAVKDEGATLAKQLPRNHHALNLAGAFSDRHQACVPIHPFDGILATVPIATENLNRVAGDPFCHLC